MRLHVITAVSRPDNLRFLQRHLRERLCSLDVCWHCVADTSRVRERPMDLECTSWLTCDQRDRAGGAQKNVGLSQATDGWVYFLDDDNTIHPQFEQAFCRAVEQHPEAVGHVFGQVDGHGRLLRTADPGQVRCGGIDLGQFVLRADVLNGLQFAIDVYHSDWLLFAEVWARLRERIDFHEPATFYNALADGPAGFSSDWFSNNLPMLERVLLRRTTREHRPLQGLEIGSFEGRSACWFLDHVLTDPQARLHCIDTFRGVPEVSGGLGSVSGALIGLEERFLRNVRPHGERVVLHKAASFEVLRSLPAASFDFAYVDGSHTAADVLEDLVHCYRLLKPDGALIADDYEWRLSASELHRPRLGIDAFLQVFAERVDVLESGYAIALRRRAA